MATWDLVVIGGGSGGVRAARIAAQHGAKVALVEEHRLGGTCVIRGCVPKKLMVYASRFAQEFEEAAGFGWHLADARFDWPTLKANRDREVARLEAVYRTNLLQAGVTIFDSRAVLQSPRSVRLADGKVLDANTVLLATGGIPDTRTDGGQDFPGAERAIDSNGFFDLPALPRRVVVLGAGYIAVELACILRLLGAAVTLVVRGPGILRGFDDGLRAHLAQELAHHGIEFRFGRHIASITDAPAASGVTGAMQVTLDNQEVLAADCVLRATGRRPHTHGLGLQNLGVALDAVGAVTVDAYSQSSVPGVYAVGDVTNRVNLTPMAIREGHAFADTVFGARPRTVDHSLVPSAVFTTPEAGTVGLTEAQALLRYPQLDVYSSNFRPMKATLSGHRGRMFFKLLVDRATDKVLGFHAVGPDAGEMAQLVAICLQLGATKAAFDATLAVHPTAAEELVTMRTPSVRHGL